jgi:hypothetical protein
MRSVRYSTKNRAEQAEAALRMALALPDVAAAIADYAA